MTTQEIIALLRASSERLVESAYSMKGVDDIVNALEKAEKYEAAAEYLRRWDR